MRRRTVLFTISAALVTSSSPPPALAGDPLPSWNVGAVKDAVMDFVSRVTKVGGADFVAPAERMAVFDNDGTLWAEKPMYHQVFFAIDRVKSLAPNIPTGRERSRVFAFDPPEKKGP